MNPFLPRWLLGGALLVATALLDLVVSPTWGGFSASITNTNDLAGSAQQFTCAGAQSSNENLLGQWYLNEPSGSTTAVDHSPNANTGTYQGSMTTDASNTLACPRDTGGAYVLDGSTSYVSTTHLYAPTNVFSLETWFKTTTTSGGMLVGFGNSPTGLSGE
ncbi:MAG: LamG domain-containing protein, partial [Acidimicrobiaceae bacterium]|nr:LamG domain-containing protein [Acidimicrobiaceae bacterium]